MLCISRTTKKLSALIVKSERRHIRRQKYEKPIIQPYDPMAADIYGVGIVLFLRLTYDLEATFQMPQNLISRIPKKLSPEAQDLLKNILNSEPLKRFKINQILNNPWIK